MNTMFFLGYLIKAAQSDPEVKDYKICFDGQHPTFEINVNGNVEHVTFLASNTTAKGLLTALLSTRKGDSNDRA